MRSNESRPPIADPASVARGVSDSSGCRPGAAAASIARVLAILLALCPTPLLAQSPPELYERGLQAMRERQFAQAVRDFQQAIALNPGLAKAHGALGTLYFQLGRLDEAERHLERALSLDAGMAQAAVNLAQLYVRTERLDAAISAFEKIARDHPRLVPARAGLAAAYQKDQRFEDAVRAYRQLLELDPRSAEALTNLASCHEALNEEDKAIELYRAAIEVSPSLAAAKGNLGAIYQRRGDLDTALPLLEDAIRLDPDFTAARYHLALILVEKKSFERARAELEAVIAREPDHVGAHYNLARAYFRLGRAEEGKREMEAHRKYTAIAQEIERSERLAAGEPGNPERHHDLGLVCEEHGRPGAAIRAYRTAISVAPDHTASHLRLAVLYVRERRYLPAMRAYEAVVRLDPGQHEALDGLARLYIASDVNLEEAIRLARKAFETKSLPRYLETEALAHLGAGRREDARRVIQEAIRLDPNEPSFRRTLARIDE